MRQLLLVIAQQLNAGIFDQLTEKNIQRVTWFVVAMFIVWGIMIGLDALLNIKEESVSLDIQQSIRENVANKMTASEYLLFQSKSSGHYLSWLNNDITIISQKGLKQGFNLVRGISGVIFAGYAMIQYHWTLLVATVIGFICMFCVPKIFNKRIYEVSKEVTQGNEVFVSTLEDQINGYPIYFAFSSLSQFIKKIRLASQALKIVMMKQMRLDATIIAVNFSINVLFQILLTVIAAICYFNGWVLIGAVAIVGSLADIIFSGLGNMSYQITSIKSIQPIFDKYEALLPEEFEEPLLSRNPLYKVENLSLTYEDDKIFEGISFAINSNDKCLISGLSGSGKSSLVKILLGYYHDFIGSVQYRGININEISSKSIAREVIYIPQQSHVFKGTVKENIQLGETFSNDKIIEILSLVGFINVDKLLNSDATELSGGQKQRLALARAFIRQPKVLICDEITSALDKDSAMMIENILLNQEKLTVIMITHSLHSGRNKFDLVIDLN